MPAPHSPSRNHLLAALPAAELDRLSAHLELVPMPLGRALYESRGHIDVFDGPGLEKAVRECYAVVKKEFDRLLADIPRGDPIRIAEQSDRYGNAAQAMHPYLFGGEFPPLPMLCPDHDLVGVDGSYPWENARKNA